MKAIIIGCGYVGSKLASFWQSIGVELTVTTTTKARESELAAIASQVIVVRGDDFSSLEKIIADKDVVVLSVAAQESTPTGYKKAYLETATNLVRAIKGSKARQLIYTSSYGILGNQDGDRVDETISVNPATEKGKIMHETEKVLLSAENVHHNLHTCIFRLSGIYGQGRELIKIFQKRSGTTQPGEGAENTNWVHVDDIVRAIDHAQKNQLQGIYNLTSDEILTTKEFFHKLFQAHNLADITWDSSQPSNRRINLLLSNQKLKDTGFQFAYPQIQF